MKFRTSEQGIELSPIKEMELRASRIPDVISLAQGIPSFDTPEPIKQHAAWALSSGKVAKYSLSPGLPELRELIEDDLAMHSIYYDYQTEILVTAGSIEAITGALLAILYPEDEVILFSPSYASYAQAVRVAHGRVVWVPLDEERGWAIPFDKLRTAITSRTRAILFASPNNPTGTLFSKEDLIQLGELARTHDFLLLIDEVYKELLYTNEPFFSLSQRRRYRKHIVLIYSFSKAYAMTGWRIAYCATHERLAREILKVHDALVTCAPVISQYAAIAALTEGGEGIRETVANYRQRLDLICRSLDRMKNFFEYQRPNSAYFVFPKLIPPVPSKLWSIKLLENARVAVVPGSAFGPTGEYHVRMCFGRSQEDITEAFNRIHQYLYRA